MSIICIHSRRRGVVPTPTSRLLFITKSIPQTSTRFSSVPYNIVHAACISWCYHFCGFIVLVARSVPPEHEIRSDKNMSSSTKHTEVRNNIPFQAGENSLQDFDCLFEENEIPLANDHNGSSSSLEGGMVPNAEPDLSMVSISLSLETAIILTDL
jgi:hypothetical protein